MINKIDTEGLYDRKFITTIAISQEGREDKELRVVTTAYKTSYIVFHYKDAMIKFESGLLDSFRDAVDIYNSI